MTYIYMFADGSIRSGNRPRKFAVGQAPSLILYINDLGRVTVAKDTRGLPCSGKLGQVSTPEDDGVAGPSAVVRARGVRDLLVQIIRSASGQQCEGTDEIAGVHPDGADGIGVFHANGSRFHARITEHDASMAEPVAGSTVREVLATFEREWATVPPLIRAMVASILAIRAKDTESNYLRSARDVEALGLERRGRVMRDGAAATSMIVDLFARLTRAADVDVAASGVDVTANFAAPTRHDHG